MNSAPSLWRSRGSSARTSRVPKMEGSTPDQSVLAASVSMASWGGGKREGGGVFEQAAIEAGDFLEEQGGVVRAGGHFLPQRGDQHGEAVGRVFHLIEEFFESVFRQQADVFGEHGEEAALEKTGDDARVVLVRFEGLGKLGKAACDVAGDFGGFLGRV